MYLETLQARISGSPVLAKARAVAGRAKIHGQRIVRKSASPARRWRNGEARRAARWSNGLLGVVTLPLLLIDVPMLYGSQWEVHPAHIWFAVVALIGAAVAALFRLMGGLIEYLWSPPPRPVEEWEE